MHLKSKLTTQNGLIGIVCLLIAFVFVFLLSPTTSFLYQGKVSMIDQVVFYTIGKYWFKGECLPYVDIWEMKGPMILFINGLGYWFSHSLHGVAWIQIPCFVVIAYYTQKVYRKNYSFSNTLFLTIGTILCMALSYEGGDNCEEFCLPFMMVSYYFFYRWINRYEEEGVVEHNPKWAFMYGIVLGMSLMIRLTNALGVMGGVTVICVVLLVHKKWKNLLQNALWFIAGFALMVLPFVIYFWSRGALYDMWYGTFLYNLSYVSDAANTFSINRTCTVYLFGTLLVLLGVYFICRKLFIRGCLWLGSSLLLMLWLSNSNGFAHYGNLCYPCLCIVLTEFPNAFGLKQIRLKYLVAGCVLLGIALFGLRLKRTMVYARQLPDTYCEALVQEVPKSEFNSFALYNCPYELYYYDDIKPVVPYFGLQDFVGYKSPVLANMISDSFEQKRPKWILFKPWTKPAVILPILQSQYIPYKSLGAYTLYKHK